MKDIVCCILTSTGCGHCLQMRGDGVLGDGRPMNSYKFLNLHLKIPKEGQSITLLNIHFRSMRGSHGEITDVSKHYIKSGKIIQERYYPGEKGTFVDLMSITSSEKAKKILSRRVAIDKKGIDWETFLRKRIPEEIQNYTYYYPAFVIFSKESWVSRKNLIGITNAGFTVRDQAGEYKLEKNPQSLQQRGITGEQLIRDIFDEKVDFGPHKDFMKVEEVKEEPKVEEVKEEPKVEEVIKENGNLEFVLKFYDDDE